MSQLKTGWAEAGITPDKKVSPKKPKGTAIIPHLSGPAVWGTRAKTLKDINGMFRDDHKIYIYKEESDEDNTQSR